MASYLPSVTDTLPELPLYQPNMGFFQQMLQRKSAQYEQGYSQVKSAYDSILNAPLSDQANIATRDEYVRQAKDKLKNLASVDLSQQENVDSANGVFAPFWEDNMLLMDSAFTKSTQEEMQKGMRLRDSKNKEDRDQYSDIAMQYLANGLEPLKNAGRNPDAYKNLEKRRFTPFVNEKEYWNTQAKNMNFEVNWSDPSGPYLINTKNGQRAEQSFRAFAEGMISPQMENQYKVIGTVEKEGRIKQVKAQFPGVNDKQALEYIAKDVITDVRKNYKTALTGLTDESATVQSKLDAFVTLGKTTPLTAAQENRYRELADYQDKLAEQIKAKTKEFEGVADDSGANAIEVHNNIVDNPDYYFTKLSRSRSINNWAAAASSNTSKKVEINPVWKEQNDVAYQQQTLNLQNRRENREDAQFDFEQEKFEWTKLHPTKSGSGSEGSTDANGNYTPSASELDRANVLGAGTTDVTRAGSALDIYQGRQNQRLAVADDAIYSMEGLGNIAAKLPGVNTQDVVNYFSAMKRGEQGRRVNPEYTTDLTPEEKASKSVIDQALKGKTGISITGPGTLKNAMLAYSQQYFKDKTSDGGTGLSQEDIVSFVQYNTGTQARNEFNELEKKRKELVQNQLMANTDPKIQRMVVTRPDGSKDFVNGTDVGKAVGGINFQNAKISASELGKAFLDNRLEVEPTGNPYGDTNANLFNRTIRIGDKQLVVNPAEYNAFQMKRQQLAERYGNPIEFVQSVRKFNEGIVPNLPEYNNQTGKMGVNFQYQMDGKITKGGTERGTRLVQEIAQAGNRGEMWIDGEMSKDKEIISAITGIGNLAEKDLEQVFSNVIYKTVGVNGRPSLQVTVAPINDNNKTLIGETKLKDVANKTIEIEIASGATGPTLRQLPNNEGNYIYSSLLRGKSLKSDPMMDSANFSYTIIPDNTDNPTKAYVDIKRKQFNTKTGKYDEVAIPRTTIPFFGAEKKTPDELVNALYANFAAHLQANKASEEAFKKQATQTGSVRTIDQIDAERAAAKIGQ